MFGTFFFYIETLSWYVWAIVNTALQCSSHPQEYIIFIIIKVPKNNHMFRAFTIFFIIIS